MDIPEKKAAAPPYVAYKTLANFLDRFKQGLPGRIDRGLMASMSGAAQSQVTTALRYLGMISENNIPQPIMKQYVTGEEEVRRIVLRDMLKKSYPFIFDENFDITTATAHMLREAFVANTTASGETVGRCIAFFKDAAVDAGLPISQFIMQKSARSVGGGKKRGSTKKAPPVGEPIPAGHQAPPAKAPYLFAAQSSLMLMGLFNRLPPPGNKWSHDERERWVQTLQNVLLLEYPEN
jgi:hypothetical protein